MTTLNIKTLIKQLFTLIIQKDFESTAWVIFVAPCQSQARDFSKFIFKTIIFMNFPLSDHVSAKRYDVVTPSAESGFDRSA